MSSKETIISSVRIKPVLQEEDIENKYQLLKDEINKVMAKLKIENK